MSPSATSPVGTDVFISYAQDEDGVPAADLADRLEAAGVTVWIANRSLAGAQNYGPEVVQAISNCKVLAVLCSAASLDSPHVAVEVEMAFESRRPRLPLLLDETPFPDQIRYWLTGANWIDIRGRPDRWFPELLRALGRLGIDGQPGSDAAAAAAAMPGARAAAPRPQARPTLTQRLRRRWPWLAAAVAAIAIVVGGVVALGGGGSGTGGLSQAQAGRDYAAVAGPTNTEQEAFAGQSQAWDRTTTGVRATTVAGPLSAALQRATQQIQRIASRYPPAARVLNAELRAAAAVQRDLGDLVRLNEGLTLADWSQRYKEDLAILVHAADASRVALGLPPAGPPANALS